MTDAGLPMIDKGQKKKKGAPEKRGLFQFFSNISYFDWNNSFQYQQTDEFYRIAGNYTLEKSDTEGRNNLSQMCVPAYCLFLVISHKKA